MRIRLDISYDGTNYQGWQKQKHTDETIQTKLESCLKKLFAADIQCIGSGRTDSGVHARQQSVHFDLDDSIQLEKYKILSALNSMIPSDISADQVYHVKKDFHALSSAEEKYYIYQMYLSKYPKALRERYFHQVHQKIDFKLFNSYLDVLKGKKDFKSFQTAGTPVPDTIREIRQIFLRNLDDGILELHIQGDGFLKQMVRNLVGTLLDLDKRLAAPEELSEILQAKDRSAAGKTAPAKALFLHKVSYPSAYILKKLS